MVSKVFVVTISWLVIVPFTEASDENIPTSRMRSSLTESTESIVQGVRKRLNIKDPEKEQIRNKLQETERELKDLQEQTDVLLAERQVRNRWLTPANMYMVLVAFIGGAASYYLLMSYPLIGNMTCPPLVCNQTCPPLVCNQTCPSLVCASTYPNAWSEMDTWDILKCVFRLIYTPRQ